MSTKGRFALGALVGALAGVVAGVLTAPKSGKETRTSIKDKAHELKLKSLKRSARHRRTQEKQPHQTAKK